MKRPIIPTIILAAVVSLVSVFASAQADVENESAARQYLSDLMRSWIDAPIIVDPANGKAIGAITIGIDAEGLLML